MHPAIPQPEGNTDPRRIRYFGCVRCQKHHFEGTREWREHWLWQSKHGVQDMSREAYFALVCEQN